MSRKNRRNRHHFLPKHHLEHFADRDGLLYVYDRENGWRYRQDIAQRLARENYLYAPEVTDETGRDPRDDSVEVWLADEIDAPAAPALDRLLAGARLEELTDAELHALADFFAVLDMRTPRVRDLLVPGFAEVSRMALSDTKGIRKRLFRQGVRATLGEITRLHARHAERIITEQAKPSWLDFIQSTRAIARVNVKDRRWSTVPAVGNDRFATNDLGMVKSLLGPDAPVAWEPGTARARAHWLVPLSPQLALAITPKNCPVDPTPSSGLVTMTNRQLFLDARRYVYSRDLIDVSALLGPDA